MKIIQRAVCAALAVIVVASFAGCSSQKSSSQAGGNAKNPPSGELGGKMQKNGITANSGASSGTDSSAPQILGKVTSIIGNEVVLAIGTLSDDTNSSELTLTGESKTLLIPVGLTLSGTGAGAAAAGGAAAGEGRTATAGSEPAGAAAGTAAAKSSASAQTGASSKSNTAAKSGTASVASTYSSITSGNVLRITQKTINGTLTVVKVAVVSKS